jgi:membrane associated rhomboid family serine protease
MSDAGNAANTAGAANATPCVRHPDRRASVVCAHCDRPICTDCMLQASVGWQCPDCVQEGEKRTRVIRPFGDRTHTGAVGSTNPTPVVLGLIAVNVISFVASGFGSNASILRFGEQPENIHIFHQYYRLFTAMFLHLDFLHIAFNMVTLLIVGPAVEVMLGKARFLTLYLLAGLGGGVASYLFGPAGEYGAGASGAIFGVMGAYVVLAQRNRKPMAAVVFLIVVNLALGFVGGVGTLGNIDWRAHIGGLLVGAGLGLVFDISCNLREVSQRVALAAATSAATLAVLALLILSIAPGHVNLS